MTSQEKYKIYCIKYGKEYYERNKENIKKYLVEKKFEIAKTKKKYAEANKVYLAQKQKEWREKNKELIKQKNLKKYNTNYLYKLKTNLKTLIGNSFRNSGFKKLSKTEQILGCSFTEFKAYLETKFEPWMNWSNRGLYNGEPNYGWDIDHIIPLSTAKDEHDIIRLNHYTNLQPLCSKINRYIKRDNIVVEEST